MKRQDFVNEIRTYIDTPFKHQGRLPGIGIDCAGVVICASKKLGQDFEDLTNYNLRPTQEDVLSKILESGFYDVEIENIDIGDLLLMSYDNNIQHIAVVSSVNPTYIIHSVTNKKVIEHRLTDVWKDKIRRCFRFDEKI